MDADDRAFDLLRAVADHADSTGLARTTRLVERAMDALLAETGRVSPAQEARWNAHLVIANAVAATGEPAAAAPAGVTPRSLTPEAI
jgi:hypothetical protein